VTGVRRFSIEQRRARLVRRHRLAPGLRAADPLTVAGDLVALHATDPASVYLAAWARLREPRVAAVESALYEQRTLIRMLGMRRTMFVLPTDLAPVVEEACTRAIAVKQRKLLEQHLALENIPDPAGWLRDVESSTGRALETRGEATAAELSTDEPRLRTQLLPRSDKPYETAQNITTRVLFLLAAEGRIVRGRPRGSWTSSQYRWSPMDAWLPGGGARWSAEEARVELARRWLRAYGPGTVADLRWWTGWTATGTRKALAPLNPVEVTLDAGTGLLLPDDEPPDDAPGPPAVALLPALDPTVMGWTGRDWYLGAHAPALFDRSGNPGPTVWWGGRVIGGWAQRSGGDVVYQLLEDVGSEAAAAVAAEAARLTGWLGPVRVTPRFRTPLERALTAD
jgi:hypothetical protein